MISRRTLRLFPPCLALITWCALTGCSASPERVAEESIRKFHSQLNAGEYGDIYARAAPELRRRLTEPEFTATLRSVNSRLGRMRRVELPGGVRQFFGGWQFGTGGRSGVVKKSVMVHYEKGVALENFEWATGGGQATLIDYRCQGPIVAVPDK